MEVLMMQQYLDTNGSKKTPNFTTKEPKQHTSNTKNAKKEEEEKLMTSTLSGNATKIGEWRKKKKKHKRF